MSRVVAILVSLCALAVSAQGRFSRFEQRSPQGRSTRGFPGESSQPPAFFEFAPSNGSGMGSACAGTIPTSVSGVALTFTRATVATCLRGNTSSGINNGDLVKLTSGQPRVMPGGDGSGPLGLLVEGARTNNLIRSEEFNDAVAWADSLSGAAAPTRTADQAVAPDGTTTADRLQFPAVNGAFSMLVQAASASTSVGTVFVKGNAQSGTIVLAASASVNPAANCNYNPDTWTRCQLTGVTNFFFVGACSGGATACTAGTKAALDVFLWGAQSEVGTFATSYIPTTTIAVPRNEEVATFDLGADRDVGSVAVTRVGPTFSLFGTTGPFYVSAQNAAAAASSLLGARIQSGSTDVQCTSNASAANNPVAGSGAITSSTSERAWCARSASQATIGNVGGVSIGPGTASAATIQARFIRLGNTTTASPTFQSVHKQVCFDPTTTRCR